MHDLLDTVVLLGVLQGLGLALVLALRRRDRLANRLLGALMAAVAAMLLNDYGESRWAFAGHPHVLGLAAPLPFTFGPLLYLYVVALTRPVSKADPRWLVHALPALADLVYMTANFYLLDGDEKLAVVRGLHSGRASASYHVVHVFQALQAVSYLAASFRQLQRYGHKVQGYFSDLDGVDLRWLKSMVIVHAATWSFAVASTVLNIAGVDNSFLEALSGGVQVGSTLVIFLTGYMSLWQPALFEKADAAAQIEPRHEPETNEPQIEPAAPRLAEIQEPPRPIKYRRNRIDDAEAKDLVERLLRLMEEERPYRDGTLTLPDLAEAVGVTPHELSQILNVRIEKSFYAFVNSYRIAEIKKALADPDQSARGVLEIALEAGFNSKSTLNSFFKRETGLTPTEYRSQAQKPVRQIEAA
jgi:AraC-like DNA-binding protein